MELGTLFPDRTGVPSYPLSEGVMDMGWHDALDSQARAFAMYDGPRGRRYARGWAEAWGEGGDRVHSATGKPVSEGGLDVYRTAMMLLPDAILAADTVYVEDEMLMLARGAAQTFLTETLHESDLPVPNGYLYLPEPEDVYDRHDKRVTARVYIWMSSPGGVVVYLMHRLGDRDDYTDDAVERRLRLEAGLGREDLMIVHVFPIGFGQQLPTFESEGMHGTAAEALRTLVVLWRLMQQTIATTTRERPARAVRRRMPPPLMENLITVIRLRRPHKDRDRDQEVRSVDWHQRWIVSGHWRWQPYPTLGVTKQIWISPYVKGPEDRPLVIRKARVLNLAR